MPPYYLTAQLPYILLGTDAINDPDLVLDPNLTHEKKACVFHRVDSQIVAEKLLDLFRHGIPAPPADLNAPAGTIEVFKNLLEWASLPVFGIVDTANLELAERVFCRERIAVLEKIEAVGDWDPAVWAAGGLPHDKRTALLVRLRYQAQQWEPLVREELDVAHGKAKGFYLWWTWWDVSPPEPAANLKKRTYFYRVDTEDAAARIRGLIERDFGDEIRFGYTASEALDIDEIVSANNSIEKYRRGEYTGEDANLFKDARYWEYHSPAAPLLKPQPQKAADDEHCAATRGGPNRSGSPGPEGGQDNTGAKEDDALDWIGQSDGESSDIGPAKGKNEGEPQEAQNQQPPDKLVPSQAMPETEYFLWITLNPEWKPEELCFYALHDSSEAHIAKRLCTLFAKKYADAPDLPPHKQADFSYTPVSDLDPDSVFLIREEIERFRKPNDWDPKTAKNAFNNLVGLIHDREMLGSFCFQQASLWEKRLRQRESTAAETADPTATVKPDSTRALPAEPPTDVPRSDGGTEGAACTVICLNERLAGILRQAGLTTISTPDLPVYEYAPALYVHAPEVVLGAPDTIWWMGDDDAGLSWFEHVAEEKKALNSALKTAGHPPLARELPPQHENLRKGLDSGALIAVAFIEPVKVDIRYRKCHLGDGTAEGRAFTAEDAARLFGAQAPILEYAIEGLCGLVPVAIHQAEYIPDLDVHDFSLGAFGLRYEMQEPPNSRFAVSSAAPQWATSLLPLIGPVVNVKLDTTVFGEKDRLIPLFQNMAGDLLGCAYRSEKGAVLVLPRCKDEAAKVKLLGMLATDLWGPIQTWLRAECLSDFGGSGCVFSVRPCNEAKPQLRQVLQAVKLHRLLFLWFAHARRWNCRGHWETIDRCEMFDPDDLKQNRGEQPLPAEVLFLHAKGLENFANAACRKFGTGEGEANVYDEGLLVFWPEWRVWVEGVGPLEASADEICRLTIAVQGQHAQDWAFSSLVEKCRGLARCGFPKWSPHCSLPWSYLSDLDGAIVSLKHAIWEEKTKSGIGEPRAAQETEGVVNKATASSDPKTADVPREPGHTMEQPWSDDAPEYLPLTQAIKLTNGQPSLQTLSKLMKPAGEMHYMRKKGVGCKVHIGDFRRYMKSQQSNPAWAKAYMSWLKGAGTGRVRIFWRCKKCGQEYPENATATTTCTNRQCGGDCEPVAKRPPEPRK